MLNVIALALGDYQTNCYIVHKKGSAGCIVIDPGYPSPTILQKIEALNLNLEAILLTHCHFDHVGGVRELAMETDCKVFLCPADLVMPPMLTAGPLYYTDTYQEGSTLSLAGMTIQVLHTPGHTPGSVCLRIENALFSGDTLFAGSCGRTDLPGGSWETIGNSLYRLARIPEDLQVFPGHGESTTLAQERMYNPYLR